MNPKRQMLVEERRRKARIRRIRRENIEIIPHDGKWALRLKLDHQSFHINERYGVTKKKATWTSTQLAIALNRFRFGD